MKHVRKKAEKIPTAQYKDLCFYPNISYKDISGLRKIQGRFQFFIFVFFRSHIQIFDGMIVKAIF